MRSLSDVANSAVSTAGCGVAACIIAPGVMECPVEEGAPHALHAAGGLDAAALVGAA